MTLTGWDLREIDALAAKCAKHGKVPANAIYRRHAGLWGWWGTPAYVPGRERFVATWRAERARLHAGMWRFAEDAA